MRSDAPMPDAPGPDPRRLKRAGLIAGGIAALVVAAGLTTRLLAVQELKTLSAAQAVPTVSVLHPTSAANGRTVALPGTVEAWSQAPVYARTNGYLKAWYVDIGTPVQAGQLLAEIDAPDVDQQVQAAIANLATAEANLKLAETTAARWQKLVAQEAVSRQAADEKMGDLAVKRATVNSVKADLDRLRTLQGFRRLVAPFDGVITSRNTDVGALIAAGNGSGGNGSGGPLFTVADIRKLRVYVRVPQSYSTDIGTGLKARLSVPEYPGRTFEAEFLNMSGAVAAGTGTMLVQLVLDNADGALKPGAYAQVSFALPASATAVRIPASALLFRKEGMLIATVNGTGEVAIRPVAVTRDFGAEVEIATGLATSELVIDSPPEALVDGDKVHILEQKAAPATAAR